MTLLVRDEADIVATNIEYHLARGVDFVIATDNRSVDGTTEILERYRSQGVLHLIHEPADDYAQHQWVTRMARLAQSEFGADWVINNDADEFWWPEAADSLGEALGAIAAGADAALVQRYNFVPRRQTTGADFVDVMTVREVRSLNAMGAPLPPKVCHRAFHDIETAQGNHSARRSGRPLEALPAPVSILHFPLRTYRQFAHKIAVGGAANERITDPQNNVSTWQMLYEKLKLGALEDYYRALELDDDAIERGLAEGRLVRDGRLREFVRRRGIAGRH